MFNWVDYVILLILIASMTYSFIRGFVRELFSLIVLLLAFWIALAFADLLSTHLAAIIVHPVLQFAASFTILFVVTLMIGAVIGWVLSKVVERSGLSVFDHFLGLLFGFVRGFTFILVALFITQMIYTTVPDWWNASFLVPKIWHVMHPLEHILPQSLQQHIQEPLRG